MTMLGAAARSTAEAAPRQRHPRPDGGIPVFSWPTIALAVGALVAFALAAAIAITGCAPVWVAVVLSTAVTYVMFTVAHETTHFSFSSRRWANAIIGRVAWLFVVPTSSLPAWRYVHLQHHQHTNDVDKDPDMFATHAPGWQLPMRWALIDVFYAVWYARRLPDRLRNGWRRPAAEVAETLVVFTFIVTVIAAAVLTGHFGTFALVVLIPQRIGILILGFMFDWLPHHDLRLTQRENRYRATRIRVGLEWLLGPLMLWQNYHLIHHLHPWLPFFRYREVWRRNQELYLEHSVAVSTLLGRELRADEFRRWKQWAPPAPESHTV